MGNNLKNQTLKLISGTNNSINYSATNLSTGDNYILFIFQRGATTAFRTYNFTEQTKLGLYLVDTVNLVDGFYLAEIRQGDVLRKRFHLYSSSASESSGLTREQLREELIKTSIL